MSRRLSLVVVLCAAAVAGFAQLNQQAISMGTSQSGPPRQPDKVTPEQQKYGKQLLEIAEGDAAGLEGGMRAFACWQLARGYERTDKKKALELLENGLTALRGWDDDTAKDAPPRLASGKSWLQQQILMTMVPLAPERANELLTQVEPSAREKVLIALMGYYEKTDQSDRVIEVIYRIGQENEIPYAAAIRVMNGLKPEQSGEVLQLFSASLASYRAQKHEGATMGDDFGRMITTFWSRLPKNLVRDAIDEVLHQAEEADKQSQGKTTMSMSSSEKGAVSFTSSYDYRLFQLLPVLRRIDESAAKALLEKHQQIAATLDKFPDGISSVQPPDPDDRKKQGSARSNMNFAVSGNSSNIAAKMQEMARAQKLLADADTHPEQVLANVSTIQDPSLRAQTLSNLARMAWKKHPSDARTALDRMTDLLDKVESRERLMLISNAADTYLQMDDTDAAKKMVEKGLKAAAAAYEEDSNADNPNKALKAYWPSANAYSSMLRLAGKIAPTWAFTLLKEISDPEIKANAEIALATAWLGVSAGTQMTQSAHKNGNMMSISESRME